MASKSPGVEQNPHDGDNKVTILVDSGAPRNYSDDQLVLQLKHRLFDHIDLTVLRKIIAAEVSLLDGATEGLVQGFVIDEYGQSHLSGSAS